MTKKVGGRGQVGKLVGELKDFPVAVQVKQAPLAASEVMSELLISAVGKLPVEVLFNGFGEVLAGNRPGFWGGRGKMHGAPSGRKEVDFEFYQRKFLSEGNSLEDRRREKIQMQ